MDNYNLIRFISAQENNFDKALRELQNGKKQSHWMWYIFPQINGLGYSEMAKYYAIKDVQEAGAYFDDQILGGRLKKLCDILLDLPSHNARAIFGSPDDLKLKSSMTLFASLPNADPIFDAVLQKFFDGTKDKLTLQILIDLL